MDGCCESVGCQCESELIRLPYANINANDGKEGKRPYRYFHSEQTWSPSLNVMASSQKGRVVFTGAASATILDAACSVPVIDFSTSYRNAAKLIIDSPSHLNEWQRELEVGAADDDENRAQDIGDFWASDNANIVNTAMLGLKPDATNANTLEEMAGGVGVSVLPLRPWYSCWCPECDEDLNTIAIAFLQNTPSGQLLLRSLSSKINPNTQLWGENCPRPTCDYHFQTLPQSEYNGTTWEIRLDRNDEPIVIERPIVIVDGQHRIRGTQSGQSGVADVPHPMSNRIPRCENLFFSLMPNHQTFGFDSTKQAKVFSEINTKSKHLPDEHKALLFYKFGIDNASVFGKNSLSFAGGSAARLAYEAVLKMGADLPSSGMTYAPTSTPPSFTLFENKIPLLKKISGRTKFMTLKNLTFASDVGLAFDVTKAVKPASINSSETAKLIDTYFRVIRTKWELAHTDMAMTPPRPGVSPQRTVYWDPPSGTLLTNLAAVRASDPNYLVDQGADAIISGSTSETWKNMLSNLLPKMITEYRSRYGASDGYLHHVGGGIIEAFITPISHCNFEGSSWELGTSTVDRKWIENTLWEHSRAGIPALGNQSRLKTEFELLNRHRDKLIYDTDIANKVTPTVSDPYDAGQGWVCSASTDINEILSSQVWAPNPGYTGEVEFDHYPSTIPLQLQSASEIKFRIPFACHSVEMEVLYRNGADDGALLNSRRVGNYSPKEVGGLGFSASTEWFEVRGNMGTITLSTDDVPTATPSGQGMRIKIKFSRKGANDGFTVIDFQAP